jgi:general secretion pathway protein M
MADQEWKMSVAASMNRTAQTFSQFWNARNPRERSMLAAAVAVIILGLFYVLLIDPALSGRERLSASLPAMRQQAAQLQALSREAASLPAAADAAPSTPMTKESIDAALTRKGMKAQNVGLTGDVARIQLSSVSFAGLLDWIDDMQKSAGALVVDANIVALAQPDMVNATVTLRQRKTE